jgi:hypothetical protein
MSGESKSIPALVIEVCVKSVAEFNDDVPLVARAFLLQRDREKEKKRPHLSLIHKLAKEFANTISINVDVVGSEMPMIYDSDEEPICDHPFHKWHGMWRCITEKLFLRGDGSGFDRLTFWTLVRMQPS